MKSQADVEDDAAGDKDFCECLPARPVQDSTPTVQAVDHWDRQGDVKVIRLRRLDGEEEAEIRQANIKECKVLDGLPIFLGVVSEEP